MYVSTANLTAYRLAVVQTAIARLNASRGFGVDFAYGGTTTATTTDAAHRWVVHWAPTVTTRCGGEPSGCAVPAQVNGDITGALVELRTTAFANTTAGREWFVGLATHELAHSMGLAHYGSLYRGAYQLMYPVEYVTRLHSGDVNGLAHLDPPGRPVVTVILSNSTVPSAQTLTAAIRAASSGLGGVRRVELSCTDSAGVWRVRAAASGVWDIRATTRTLTWTVPAGTPAWDARCAARVWTKAATAVSAAVPVRLGGSNVRTT